jgi:purine-binding chemotaxis protein CheW
MDSFSGATRVPGAMAHVEGIVSVRGRVVPVIDLRTLFGHECVPPTLDTRIVVVERGARVVALRVDRAREVMKLDPEQMQAAPDAAALPARGFVRAVWLVGARLLQVIDLPKVLGEDENSHENYRHGFFDDGARDRRALPG